MPTWSTPRRVAGMRSCARNRWYQSRGLHAIARTVEDRGVFFMQSFPNRFDPATQQASRGGARGELGRITLARNDMAISTASSRTFASAGMCVAHCRGAAPCSTKVARRRPAGLALRPAADRRRAIAMRRSDSRWRTSASRCFVGVRHWSPKSVSFHVRCRRVSVECMARKARCCCRAWTSPRATSPARVHAAQSRRSGGKTLGDARGRAALQARGVHQQNAIAFVDALEQGSRLRSP